MSPERETELREVAEHGASLMHFGIDGPRAVKECFQEIDRLRAEKRALAVSAASLANRLMARSVFPSWEDLY